MQKKSDFLCINKVLSIDFFILLYIINHIKNKKTLKKLKKGGIL